MIVGTFIFEMNGTHRYSPEFPRGGLAATSSADVTQVIGKSNVIITVESRNSEDTMWTTVGAFGVISVPGSIQIDLTGIKEIYRFEFASDASDESADRIHVLMQAPSWRPY